MTALLPPVVGHRGAAAHAPENTLAAIRKAAALGARAVEIDARLDGDGALVVLHDPTLDRTTDGRGRVLRLPTAAIRARDAGSWFGREFTGERVPLLDEALDLAEALGLAVNLELKAERGRAAATGRAAGAALRERATPRLLLSSFSPRCLAAARDAAPALPRALIVGRGAARAWLRTARRIAAVAVHAEHAQIDAGGVAALHEAGLALGAYTVNDPARAAALFALGVDYVFSDAPERIPAPHRAA